MHGRGFEEEIFTFSIVEHLVEAEAIAADVLHVVLFQSPLNHLRRVVLTGQLERKQADRSQYFTSVSAKPIKMIYTDQLKTLLNNHFCDGNIWPHSLFTFYLGAKIFNKMLVK